MDPGSQFPVHAAVRPRVLVEGSSTPQRLDELVRECLDQGSRRVLWLIGARGSGKTTALRHLAAVLPDEARLRLIDDGPTIRTGAEDGPSDSGVVVVAARSAPREEVKVTRCRLVAWDDDDCLDYLVHHRRESATNAFARWRATGQPHDLARSPRLCAAVLQLLAEDDAIPDALAAIDVAALRRHGAERFESMRYLALLRHLKVRYLATMFDTHEVADWFVSESVRARWAAAFLVEALESDWAFNLLMLRPDASLLADAGRLLCDQPERRRRLLERNSCIERERLAWWLMVLNRSLPGFRPPLAEITDLEGAILPGIDVSGVVFRGGLRDCDLQHACMRGADLGGVRAVDLVLRKIDGVGLIATGAELVRVELRGASLDKSNLRHVRMLEVRLDGASLRGADLTGANLSGATLVNADLRECIAVGADLAGLDLRGALLDRGRFDSADLSRARLSQKQLRGFQAEDSNLQGADLTASSCSFARLRGASLGGARLALLDAEGADLRDVDLRGASFHLGSSRSGLVHSDLASEGTRTGFCTDEALEDSFMAPEAVRKANLRGADLRGARIEGTDFYLVDLREARLDDGQRDWLRRCRAILDPPR